MAGWAWKVGDGEVVQGRLGMAGWRVEDVGWTYWHGMEYIVDK